MVFEVINIEDRDVREEIPVHLFEDYERESDTIIYYKLMEEEYEWHNAVCEGLCE